MIQVTGTAVAVVLVIGYFGISSIINGINSLFNGKKDNENNKEK